MSKDNLAVAKRYANALFEVAQESQTIDAVETDLLNIQSLVNNEPDFLTVLKHPKVTSEAKHSLLKESLGDNVTGSVLNTMLLLVDRKREDILLELIDQFVELANEARGIREATVYTVKPLSEEEEKSISETFSKRIGVNELRIKNVVDQNLIGGVKIRIGNRIFDGSVQGKLTRIERELVSAR